jgi:7-carboxy-7-deazaguanine synthase
MRIQEISESIMGELPHIGKPVTIIRFAGCNLACPYCDAPFGDGVEMTLHDIVGQVETFGHPNILITGGEPLLHRHDVERLLERLWDYHTTLETNGTLECSMPNVDCTVMDVKLFKNEWVQEILNLDNLTESDAVKFVFQNEDEFFKAWDFIGLIPKDAPYQVIFSPVNLEESMVESFIRVSTSRKDLDLRFQVQIHKILAVA